MTAPEVMPWHQYDPVWYRTFGAVPRPGEVVAVWPDCVEIRVMGSAGTYYVFPDEITRREL